MLATVVDTLRGLDDLELTNEFRRLELERRRIDAELAAVSGEGQRRSIHVIDHHHSMTGWRRANANYSVAGDIVRASLHGHIRRVVMNSASVVTDMGRRQRLFTGAARDAAKLVATRCDHPGCNVPVSFAHVDQKIIRNTLFAKRRAPVRTFSDSSRNPL